MDPQIKPSSIAVNELLVISARNGDLAQVKKLIETKQEIKLDINYLHEGETALHAAVRMKQFEICVLLIQANAKADIKNSNGQTACHLMANLGNTELLRIILTQYPAFINLQDRDGNSLLHCAVEGNRYKTLEFLTTLPLDLNIINKDGLNPWHLAADKNYTDILRHVFTKFPELINIPDKQEDTILHIAAFSCDSNFIIFLLKFHHILITGSNNNETALQRAINVQKLDNVKAFLNSALPFQHPEFYLCALDSAIDIDENSSNITSRKIVYCLIKFIIEKYNEQESQAKPTKKKNKKKKEKKKETGNPEKQFSDFIHIDKLMEWEKKYRPSLDEDKELDNENKFSAAKKSAGKKTGVSDNLIIEYRNLRASALEQVRKGDYQKAVQLFTHASNLAQKIKTKNPNWAQPTTHYEIADLNLLAAAKIADVNLLEDEKIDANVNKSGKDGLTPLMHAVLATEGSPVNFITRLMTENADINVIDENGMNALHHAARSGRTETLTALLKFPGIATAINAVDSDGRTPLYYAVFHQHTACAELLRQNHGEMEAKDTEEIDVLEMALSMAKQLKPKTKKTSQPTKPDSKDDKTDVNAEINLKSLFANFKIKKISDKKLQELMPKFLLAEAYLKEKMEIDDNDLTPGLRLLDLYRHMRRTREEKQLLDEFVAQHPENIEVIVKSALYLLGARKRNAAKAKLLHARNLFKNLQQPNQKLELKILHALLNIYLNDKNYKEAEKACNQIFAIRDDDHQALMACSKILSAKKYKTKSREIFYGFFRNKIYNPKITSDWGWFLINNREYSGAIRAFDKLSEHDLLSSLYGKGRALLAMKKYAEAKVCFEHLTREFSHFFQGQLYCIIVDSFLHPENEQKIHEDFKQLALQTNRGEPFLFLARYYQTQKNIEQAIFNFQEAIKMDHEYTRAHLELMTIYLSCGKYADIITHYENNLSNEHQTEPRIDALYIKALSVTRQQKKMLTAYEKFKQQFSQHRNLIREIDELITRMPSEQAKPPQAVMPDPSAVPTITVTRSSPTSVMEQKTQYGFKMREAVKEICRPLTDNHFPWAVHGGCVIKQLLGLAVEDNIYDNDILSNAGDFLEHQLGAYPSHFVNDLYQIVDKNIKYDFFSHKDFDIPKRFDKTPAWVYTCCDFTFCAIFGLQDNRLFDATNQGIADLNNRIIRLIIPPTAPEHEPESIETRLKQHPELILRAIYYRVIYGFTIEEKLLAAMQKISHNNLLKSIFVNSEKLNDAYEKYFLSGNAELFYYFCLECGINNFLFASIGDSLNNQNWVLQQLHIIDDRIRLGEKFDISEIQAILIVKELNCQPSDDFIFKAEAIIECYNFIVQDRAKLYERIMHYYFARHFGYAMQAPAFHVIYTPVYPLPVTEGSISSTVSMTDVGSTTSTASSSSNYSSPASSIPSSPRAWSSSSATGLNPEAAPLPIAQPESVQNIKSTENATLVQQHIKMRVGR